MGLHERVHDIFTPTICLLVVTSLFLIMLAVILPRAVSETIAEAPAAGPERAGEITGIWISALGWTIVNVMIVGCCINTLRLASYRWALTGGILAVIPVCSPLYIVGIPFGIWLLILLKKPEVQRRFAR